MLNGSPLLMKILFNHKAINCIAENLLQQVKIFSSYPPLPYPFLFSHVNLTHFLNALLVHRHSWNTKIFNEKCPLMMSSNTWTGQSDHFVFRASFHSPKQPNSKAKMLSSVTSHLDVITATGVVEVARIKVLSVEERLAVFRYRFWEEPFTMIAHGNDSRGKKQMFFVVYFIFRELSFF